MVVAVSLPVICEPDAPETVVDPGARLQLLAPLLDQVNMTVLPDWMLVLLAWKLGLAGADFDPIGVGAGVGVATGFGVAVGAVVGRGVAVGAAVGLGVAVGTGVGTRHSPFEGI